MKGSVKEFLKNILPINSRTEMPKALYAVKIFLAFWLVKFASELVGEVLALILHFACGKNPLAGEMFDEQTIALITYFGYGIMIFVVLLYWKLIMKRPLREMGLTRRFGNYFIGAGTGVLLLALSVAAVMLTGTIRFHGLFASPDYPMIALFFAAFLFQGAMEEVLCRGLVLHALKDKVPVWIAVAVSSAVFVLAHWSGLFTQGAVFGVISIVNLILISIIFSLVTLRFRSIWAACGLHSFWNAILFCILGLNVSGNDDSVIAIFDMRTVGENIWNGGVYGIEASVITAAVLAVSAVVIRLLSRKK